MLALNQFCRSEVLLVSHFSKGMESPLSTLFPSSLHDSFSLQQQPSSAFGCDHNHPFQLDQLPLLKSASILLGKGPTIDPGNTLKDRSFSQLVVFGDSLADIGNLSTAAATFGITFPPLPFAQTGSIGNAGRMTNGDLTQPGIPGNLWVEYFAPRVGLQNNVVDFAMIGSTSGHTNVVQATAADLGITLPEGLQLPGVLDQIASFVANPGTPNQKADPDALYVVWGGATDFLTLFPTPSLSSVVNAIVAGVTNVAKAVTTLAETGAETIVVPNLPNLGLTPFAAGYNSAGANVVPEATLFSIGFDLLLQPTLGVLERELKQDNPEVDIVQIDTFSLSEAIADGKFGFTNTTDPLFSHLSDPNLNPNSFAFSDPFHPTTRAHQVFADLFQSALSRPTASHVVESSMEAINNLIFSGEGASLISSLFGLEPTPTQFRHSASYNRAAA